LTTLALVGAGATAAGAVVAVGARAGGGWVGSGAVVWTGGGAGACAAGEHAASSAQPDPSPTSRKNERRLVQVMLT
jgi:hypothetical protein